MKRKINGLNTAALIISIINVCTSVSSLVLIIINIAVERKKTHRIPS